MGTRSSTRATEDGTRTLADRRATRNSSRETKAWRSAAIAACPSESAGARRSRPPYGTESGYRYDGLYGVEEYWHDVGQDGFRIWRFRLRAIPGETTVFGPAGPQPASHPLPPATTAGPSPKVLSTTLRIVRDTALSAMIKAAHDYRCQVCGIQLAVPTGFYAEAAHVQPLGSPHDGPDVSGNVLCLCPNHHVLFDKGTIWIDSSKTVQPLGTPLKRPEVHPVESKYTTYHAEHFGGK